MSGIILLSAAQMRASEQAAIRGGVASAALMEKAGQGAAEIALKAFDKRPATVICGPGNNGGDGFVAARRLAEAGAAVKLALIGDRAALKGDAKMMADLYEGEIAPFDPSCLEGAELIVDAIFGTGLVRPVEGAFAIAVNAINASPAPTLSIDLPSGVNADTGAILGVGVNAARTVTFHAKKYGHVLFPGRALCGAVDVIDIGIKGDAAGEGAPDCYENHPALWAQDFSRPDWRQHKYHRGHVYVLSGGPAQTGAARLAAMGALRIGAGLVTAVSPVDALSENAAHLTAIMLRQTNSADDIAALLHGADRYRRVALIGPGAGVGAQTREKTLAILKSNASAVIDADALTSFAEDPDTLFTALRQDDVLTPHSGEFARLFADIDMDAGKIVAARAAAKRAGCVVLLKGSDTVIAEPGGRAVVNVNAPPDLATAGAGDVLAGFVAGLRAQSMPGFEAAAAAAWFHGACAQAVGPGLIAEDLPGAVRPVLAALLTPPQSAERS